MTRRRIVDGASVLMACGAVAACLLAPPFAARGQFQVNMQVNQGAYAGIHNPSSPSYGSVRYVSQAPGQNSVSNPMLGSQERFMNRQSGNLPSQLRYGQGSAGMLAPTQVQTPLSAQAYSAKRPGSSAVPQGSSASVRHAAANRPMAVQPASSAPINGSVRYGSPR